jgi:hypothetical protein
MLDSIPLLSLVRRATLGGAMDKVDAEAEAEKIGYVLFKGPSSQLLRSKVLLLEGPLGLRQLLHALVKLPRFAEVYSALNVGFTGKLTWNSSSSACNTQPSRSC